MERPTTEEFVGYDDWTRRVFDDEVVVSSASLWEKGSRVLVSEFPLVPGFFVTDAPADYGDCTRILAGPFPTLEVAIASIALTS